MVVGGVTKNAYVMDRLRSTIKDLFVPAEADVFEAIGAAACAVRSQDSQHDASRASPQAVLPSAPSLPCRTPNTWWCFAKGWSVTHGPET